MLEEFADGSEEEDEESDDADCRYPFIDEEENSSDKDDDCDDKPLGKNRVRAILKENTANYILLERLINVDFGKRYELPVFFQFCKRKSQTTAKMTICHSIELIGYQIQVHWQNNCTVLVTKDQSSTACEHFSIY